MDRAYVLHSYHYRETSLILQVWTEKHGRMGLVAKGARRPKSANRSILVPFQPLLIDWFGRGELRTLKGAEPSAPGTPLAGQALLSAFYLNELLLKLTTRDDPHEQLFAAYDEAITSLREVSRAPTRGRQEDIEPVLRRYELALLRELGYALQLSHEAGTHAPIVAEREYLYVVERGPVPAGEVESRGDAVRLNGLTLLDLERGNLENPNTITQAKSLMRLLINHCLNGQPLATRALVRDLQRLEGDVSGVAPAMIELGVNIDHVATVRQARRTYEPDPVWAAVEAHLGGADGITVHLREDRRHIQDEDVRRLRETTHIKLNLEMAATKEMIGIAARLKPEMAMLVPEGRREVTTEGGLDIAGQVKKIRPAVQRLTDAGIVVSVFIDADLKQVDAAHRVGARVCEIHTGPYAHVFHSKGRDPETKPVLKELDKIRKAGEAIRAAGMRFNAGHALNYHNVEPVAALAGIRELHIGHAIVSRAIFVGMREAVREMKALMSAAARQ